MHIRGRGLLVLLACGALLACGVLLAIVLVARGVDQANAWAGVIAGYLALAGSMVNLVTWRARPATKGVTSKQLAQDKQLLDRAVTDLATAVHNQWKQEQSLRSLEKPIRIGWSIADPRSVAANAQAQEAATAAVLHKGVVPDVRHVVQLFRKLPVRQIIVLGEGGAGKTVLALLFTLGLLESRDSRRVHEPVPVLLSASSWDPSEEHLDVWTTRRLLEDYPALATVYDPNVVKSMVESKRVMVVLDGLDEIPARLLPDAIRGIDSAVGVHPVLVTCKGDVYKNAARERGNILTRAAVLEIQPMDLDDAAEFLMAPERPSAKDRWGPVVDKLRSQSDAPLAQVLTRPLMVGLAGTAYAAPKCDPVELLRFPDEDTIEHHLLEVFIPAIYHNYPPKPGTPHQRRYSPEQARKWLTFLARHLGTDLSWWRLADTIPRRIRGVLAGLASGLLFGIAGIIGGAGVPGLSYRFEGGLILGLMFSMATGRSYALNPPPVPLHVEIQFREKLVPFLCRFVPGFGIGVVVGLGTGLPYQAALTAGPVFGTALAARVWLDETTDVTQGPDPRIVQTQDRTATIFFSLAVALPVGLLGGLVIGFPSGHAFGVIHGVTAIMAGALVGAVAAGILGGQAYGPVGRRWFTFTGAIVGGLVFEPTDTTAHVFLGPAYGVTFGLAIGFLVLISRAWGSYAVSLPWLALHGNQPWRLMRFLDDAHRRGILRRSGATYQFRHDRVRNHLAPPNPHRSLSTSRRSFGHVSRAAIEPQYPSSDTPAPTQR